jgi:hypothetical protein
MKKQVMLLFPAIFFCWLFLPSCSEESNPYFYDEPTIYSESNKIPFSEIVFFIKPYILDAGQYADLLNDYLNLQPGIYVCRIVSFDFKTASGELKTVYAPTLSFPLEVEENRASVGLGEFEIEVK